MKKILTLLFSISICLLTADLCFAFLDCTEAGYYISDTKITVLPEQYNPEGEEVYITIEGNFGSIDERACSINNEAWIQINFDGPDPDSTESWDVQNYASVQATKSPSGKKLGHVFTDTIRWFEGDGPHTIYAQICYELAGQYNDFKTMKDNGFLRCRSFAKEIYPNTIIIEPPIGKKSWNPLACESLGECFDAWANVFLWVSIAGIIIVILIAALIFITGATPNRLALAKKILLWGMAIFGIMLVIKIISSVTKNDLNP